MNVNVKERVLLTLTSGKFWVLVAAFAVAVYGIFEPGANIPQQISSAVLALGAVVGYMVTNVMAKKYKPDTKENE